MRSHLGATPASRRMFQEADGSWRGYEASTPLWNRGESASDARPRFFVRNVRAAVGDGARRFRSEHSQRLERPTLRESVRSVCTCEQAWKHRRDTLTERTLIMSASHHPTDIHLRQHRAKKRNKLRARIAAAPASGRAALEAKLQRTYSRSHSSVKENKPPTVV